MRYYGEGILNTLIDNLPFELHSPGYNYLGPGTNLQLKLEKDIQPINKLDAAAKEHDMAYSKNKELKERHKADQILENKAWERVKAKDSSLSEKINAYLTTNAMKIKRKVGMGIPSERIGKYIKYHILLTDEQQKDIYNAMKHEKDISIKLEPSCLQRSKENIINESILPLTQKQIDSIKKHRNNNMQTLLTLKLSKTQLKCLNKYEKNGGFLPALIPIVTGAITAGTALYNSYNNKKTNDKLLEEKIRHNKVLERTSNNKVLEGSGMFLKKPEGSGMYLKKNLKYQ